MWRVCTAPVPWTSSSTTPSKNGTPSTKNRLAGLQSPLGGSLRLRCASPLSHGNLRLSAEKLGCFYEQFRATRLGALRPRPRKYPCTKYPVRAPSGALWALQGLANRVRKVQRHKTRAGEDYSSPAQGVCSPEPGPPDTHGPNGLRGRATN